MSQEAFEAKKNFVDRELSRCIAAAYDGVSRLEFKYHDDGEESVIIRFADGYFKIACTTGDSLSGIMMDVMRALAGV